MRHTPFAHLPISGWAFLPILALGCARPGVYEAALEAIPAEFIIVSTPAKGELGGYPAYGTPFPVPGQPVEIVPYVRVERDWVFRDGDAFDEGGLSQRSAYYSSEEMPEEISVRWHNAVVRVRETGEQWPLLDFRGVISRVWIPNARLADGSPGPQAMLFAVTFEDINRDGVLDDQDGARVLMTDADGRNPRIVSPSGTHLDGISGRGPDGAVVLHLCEDENENGYFGRSEVPVPYLLKLEGESVAERYVNDDVRLAIEKLLGGD